MKKTKIILTAMAATLICATLSVSAYQEHELQQHRLENQAIADELMQITFTDEFDTMECAEETFDTVRLLSEDPDSSVIFSVYPETVDISVPGNRSVTFFLEYEDDLNEVHRKQIVKNITVVDTVKPVIEIENDPVEIWQNADFDASENIVSVSDAVSGILERADETAPGRYTISSNVDTGTPGTYEVTVTAQDYHGNTEAKSFEVKVYEKTAAAAYSQPRTQAGVVNFDAYFGFTDASGEPGYQGSINSGIITRLWDDYFHHNDGTFMSLFWSCGPGTTVIIGGQTYTCGGIEHGYATTYEAYTDSGASVWLNGSPDIITCDGYGSARWIMHLR